VRANGCRNHVDNRIHAIILTRDRPATLQRCIATALSSLGDMDILTILDDSTPELCSANHHLLATAPSSARRVHLPTSNCRDSLSRIASQPSPVWLDKVAPRDIAPHRNISLLLSEAIPAQTTILIDDDIHRFDLATTHRRTKALSDGCPGFIAGADIDGISELDVITRLGDAIDRATAAADGDISSHRELFRARKGSPPILGRPRKYVSAGYLAFRLPDSALFAFPPGYNEDWLWCLMHSTVSQVQVVSSGEVVIHDPPGLRQLTRADLLFELMGDVVLDSIEERSFPAQIDPETVLTCLSTYPPPADSMPSPRAFELLNKAKLAKLNGLFPILQEYGLRELATLLETRELEMDGTRLMHSWGSDAIIKQRSLELTLRDKDALAAMRSLCKEGTIYGN
jgi:hypothetical protein